MYLKNTLLLNSTKIVSNNSLTNRYCATLGHKANHREDNNAVYGRYYHPRFGAIKCIRSIRPIAKDEEICVDYGYKKNTGPTWYREYKKRCQSAEDTEKNVVTKKAKLKSSK
jgi:histone-lysine N-methyltransferase SETD7